MLIKKSEKEGRGATATLMKEKEGLRDAESCYMKNDHRKPKFGYISDRIYRYVEKAKREELRRRFRTYKHDPGQIVEDPKERV